MNAATSGPLKILLLEDSKFDAEFVGEFVAVNYPTARMHVVADETGFVEALAQGLGGAPYDVVLSDYEIPGYGGQEALEHARAVAPLTPFIFVSGIIGEENAVDMLKRGATDYVSKNRLSRLPFAIDRALRESTERASCAQAERRRRAAEAAYDCVVDTLDDRAVLLLDRQGRIRDWNRGASRLFGLPRDQAVGSHLETLFASEDHDALAASDVDLARRDGHAAIDRQLRHRDGRHLHVQGTLTALRDARDPDEVTGYCQILQLASAVPAELEAPAPPLHMLLVEDNEDAAFALSMSFGYLGYTVTHAATLRDAIDLVAARRFDVVVTDLGLPDGDGIDLAGAVSRDVPLIALSGFGGDDDRRRTSAAGFADHLVKPADPESVHAAVMRALADVANVSPGPGSPRVP